MKMLESFQLEITKLLWKFLNISLLYISRTFENKYNNTYIFIGWGWPMMYLILLGDPNVLQIIITLTYPEFVELIRYLVG